ncbi:MAG: C4-type zinc ribbon domain-containing protein [Candidatus Omnitrophota bacterium]|nr:C4-type zinc ribbon domain-containing protein [Candidatus Omnitrophota bacterium]
METIDLKSQLTSLIGLQAIDSEIYVLKAEKYALPQEIQAIDAAFEEKKQSLAALEKKLLDAQKQRKEKELELGTKEEANKKLQSQLYSLKTNNEYQTMLKQIQDGKADASVIEDKILGLFEEGDKIKAETEAEKARLKEEEKVFAGQKNKIEARIKEIDERLSVLEAQRNQASVGISPKILFQYEKILSSRDGLAIAVVKDDSCKGCNMHVPPQTINLIKMYEHIITCEVCNRILYVDSQA